MELNNARFYARIGEMAPSSSGLGRLVLIQKIAGSTPAGVTKNKNKPEGLYFLFFGSYHERTRRVRSW